jgi:hypothetical protein
MRNQTQADVKASQRITRSQAIELLNKLGNNTIASAVFVTRGDRNIKPYICDMAFRKGVKQHLKGGERNYSPAEHGLMGVYEVINLDTAIKRYRQSAQHELNELAPKVAEAGVEVQRLRLAYEVKGTKKNLNALRSAEKKHSGLRKKLAHCELKLSDHVQALKNEIEARIENREEEIAEIKLALEGKPANAELLEKLAAAKARLASERRYLSTPERSLLIRYRTINLAGLMSLTIAGRVYSVTTAPTPAAPSGADR